MQRAQRNHTLCAPRPLRETINNTLVIEQNNKEQLKFRAQCTP